jgi:transglutaminase-like putative cysteine protease
MSIRYRVRHTTTYTYAEAVGVSHHVVVLAPRGSPRQRIGEHHLEITPHPGRATARIDWFGNHTQVVTIQEAHRTLEITADSTVEIEETLDWGPSPAWEQVRDQLIRGQADPSAIECAYASPYIPLAAEFASFAAGDFTPNRSLAEAAEALIKRVRDTFTYDPAATTIATPVGEVLRLRRGVCQDFAHLCIAALRALGLSARYVSGYLETDPPPGREKLRGADASHAWISVWCPINGWIDLDPTNGCRVGIRHVTVAWGRDFGDVSPVKGVILGGGAHEVRVAVDVERVGE